MTRIISGEWRGHALPSITGGSVRPTTDRARTVLFDTLRYFQGINVLDLYSGTGALGFEALSRGAASLVSIDHDQNYIRQQNKWIDKHPAVFRAYVGDVPKILKGLTGKYDLILADPPYAEELSEEVIELIEERTEVGARFVYEKSRNHESVLDSEKFTLEKEKVISETRIQIYKAR